MLASLSSFYDNIRSYSRSGRKAGDKRRRERYSLIFYVIISFVIARWVA